MNPRRFSIVVKSAFVFASLVSCSQANHSPSDTKALYEMNFVRANGPTIGPIDIRDGGYTRISSYTLVSCPKFLDWYHLSEWARGKSKSEIRARIAESPCESRMRHEGQIFFDDVDPTRRVQDSTKDFAALIVSEARGIWCASSWSCNRREGEGSVFQIFDLTNHGPFLSGDDVLGYADAVSRAFPTWVATLPQADIQAGLAP